jgi:RNA polymerase sigma-70 factor (ECF subfamily)
MPDSSPFQSEDLVRLAKQGSIDAFESLCQHYSPQICTYLTHMIGNKEDAQDLTQETFLNAWRGMLALEKNYHFKTWLYRIATNVAYRYLSKAEHKHQHRSWLYWEEHEQLLLIEDDSQTGFEDRIIEYMMIRLALAHVSPKPRACMLLYIVGGFPQKEIAKVMGMEVAHVHMYVKRGVEQLTKAYFKLEQVQGVSGKGRFA